MVWILGLRLMKRRRLVRAETSWASFFHILATFSSLFNFLSISKQINIGFYCHYRKVWVIWNPVMTKFFQEGFKAASLPLCTVTASHSSANCAHKWGKSGQLDVSEHWRAPASCILRQHQLHRNLYSSTSPVFDIQIYFVKPGGHWLSNIQQQAEQIIGAARCWY